MNSAMIAGLTFGMLGSLHCVGMCGPLLLALPLEKNNKKIGLVLYHFGRVLCYSILGVLLSIFGISLRYSGLHEILSVVLGILMILGLILFFFNIKWFEVSIGKLWVINQMKKHWQTFFKTKSVFVLPSIGFLNGLLPCGFVYIALGFSLLFVNFVDTFLYMFFFGIGTVPALLIVSLFSQLIATKWRQKIRFVVPIGTLVVGILLIVRGLSLNIPYLSPLLNSLDSLACH